jgi:hypothetical protein
MGDAMKVTSLLTSAMLGGLVLFGARSALAAKVPLVSYFNPVNGDHFTTSHPLWVCDYQNTCSFNTGDYAAVGMQGHVWSPADPQPAGTVPLFNWFNESRQDNFLTTDPAWAGNVGDLKSSGVDQYRLIRIEGFIPTTGPSSLALKSYWNPTVADNAAIATWRYAPRAGWTQYRTEGFLLPPDSADLARCTSNATPNFTDPSAWQARGNYVDTWLQPSGFINGDAIRLTAPADWYRIDYWGNTRPVRGYSWNHSGTDYPLPGEPQYALMARVTRGRAFVNGRGWYEANQWFKALGDQEDWSGMCVLFDGTGETPGAARLQTMFNDPNIGDNGGWANVRVQQWR